MENKNETTHHASEEGTPCNVHISISAHVRHILKALRNVFLHEIHTISVTALVFAVLWALYYLPSSFAVLDPLAKAFSDIELSDLVFSHLQDEEAIRADTTIVLVNIGTLSRAGIAESIRRIATHHPRVIGVDVMFRTPKDSAGDAALQEALQLCPRTVLVSKLGEYHEETGNFRAKQESHPMFATYTGTGFANMVSSSDEASPDALPTDMIRLFSPRETVIMPTEPTEASSPAPRLSSQEEWAFAVKLAWFMDSTAVQRLFKRDKETEVINYRGNCDKFYALDVADVLAENGNLSFVEGKMVIFGFLGATLGGKQGRGEDMFFTPMNKHYAGRTFPDMFGAVIHANIASMILSGDFITTVPDWLEYTLAVLLCMLNLRLLSLLYYRQPRLYDAARLGLQFGQSIILLILFTAAFHLFRLKLEATMLVAVVAIAPAVHEIYHTLRLPKRHAHQRTRESEAP